MASLMKASLMKAVARLQTRAIRSIRPRVSGHLCYSCGPTDGPPTKDIKTARLPIAHIPKTAATEDKQPTTKSEESGQGK